MITPDEAQLTALLADAPKADDHDGVREYLHALAKASLSVLLVIPGTKQPFDGRTSRKRTVDDKVAQKAAEAAGRRNWQKVKSPAGVHLASDDPEVLDGYLDEYIRVHGEGCAVNVAVAVGRSGLVVVDCDTAEQVSAFLADVGVPANTPPTVRTPGQLGPDGTMVHRDGGHFYFTVPKSVELPELPEPPESMSVGADTAYSVFWGLGKYVLVPPSVRPEGRYEAAGGVYELPPSLRKRIVEHGQTRFDRAARGLDRINNDDSPIAAWGASITWPEILSGTDWTATGKADGCGCDTWTAPGAHASEKSATAHELGCSVSDSVDPCLHVWTDHDVEPFDQAVADHGPHLTRLRAVAAIHYDNDLGAAMTALDLHDGPVTLGGERDHEDEASGLNLPASFWAARPALMHIRQAAHFGVNSADAVLGAMFARLAAHIDPFVTVDTGVKQPMPLSMFVGLVGSAGTGKSSAHAAAGHLLRFSFPDPLNTDLVAAGETPLDLPVGSGPGVAEAFMGIVVDPVDGKTKRREQVSHKLLLHSDEGAGLVAGILDAKRGQDIGPALRAAWTGAVLGQANASAERRREVRDYVMGLCVGFQLEALAALSTAEQLEYGTPQRFLYVSATDPHIPDDAPDDPGPLTVRLPTRPLRYCGELQTRARREALARTRGLTDTSRPPDPMTAHRPAMVARLAALLVVLCDPDRTVIEMADVELAETLLDTSARLHDKAMTWRREREAAERERQTEARISEQVATTVAVANRDAKLDELGGRIEEYLAKEGGVATWRGRDGLRQKFKSSERLLADAALQRLATPDGTVVVDGDRLRQP